MRITTFEMERFQSTWENSVKYNLTESGVHALTVKELLNPAEDGNELLGYPQTNGTLALRETTVVPWLQL